MSHGWVRVGAKSHVETHVLHSLNELLKSHVFLWPAKPDNWTGSVKFLGR